MQLPSAFQGLQPPEVWRHFAALNRIPRLSGHEEAARAYVREVAQTAGARWAQDAAGNLVVYARATPKIASEAPIIAIQGHLDMVGEKAPGSRHDFLTDPIIPQLVDNRIVATGTTLGADNGIGVASALALLTTPGLVHGPLELIFTVQEEQGEWSALSLDPSLIEARQLINLDSENVEELTVGSAGGGSARLAIPLRRQAWSAGSETWEVALGGLKGGHSGLDIHFPHANPLKVLAQLLSEPALTGFAARLVSFSGGGADNALPREAATTLAVAPDEAERWQAAMRACFAPRRAALQAEEPDLQLRIRQVPSSLWPVLAADQETLLALLREMSHGVIAFSTDFPGVVETSANLASLQTSEDSAAIVTSVRSFDPARLDQLFVQLQRQARNHGGEFELQERYPGWTPHPNSELVALTASVYRKVYGHGPRLEIMHGGLECGAVVARVSGNPPMEAVSFGPQIEHPHTPQECVYPATVATMWKMLSQVLKELASAPRSGPARRGPMPPSPQPVDFKTAGFA